MRFGGEDVVRHQLVQRIVEAYDEHSARQAPELRRPADQRRRPASSVGSRSTVLGDAARRRQVERLVRARRGARRASRTGHVAVAFVDAERDRELNAEHRGKHGPTDVLSFPVDGDGAIAGGRRCASSATSSSAPSTRTTCARPSSTARCTSSGMDHETDDGEMLALQREICRWMR